jgi:proteasome lid subunit RPN8/RPN11
MSGKSAETRPPGGRRFRYAVIEEMLSAAEAAYPQEWVGALLGDRGVLEKVVTLPNEDMRLRFKFHVPPAYLASAVYANPELQLLGVVHSHPDGDSQLSPVDLQHAVPGLVYFVIPVIAGRADRIGVWEIPLASSDGMQV